MPEEIGPAAPTVNPDFRNNAWHAQDCPGPWRPDGRPDRPPALPLPVGDPTDKTSSCVTRNMYNIVSGVDRQDRRHRHPEAGPQGPGAKDGGRTSTVGCECEPGFAEAPRLRTLRRTSRRRPGAHNDAPGVTPLRSLARALDDPHFPPCGGPGDGDQNQHPGRRGLGGGRRSRIGRVQIFRRARWTLLADRCNVHHAGVRDVRLVRVEEEGPGVGGLGDYGGIVLAVALTAYELVAVADWSGTNSGHMARGFNSPKFMLLMGLLFGDLQCAHRHSDRFAPRGGALVRRRGPSQRLRGRRTHVAVRHLPRGATSATQPAAVGRSGRGRVAFVRGVAEGMVPGASWPRHLSRWVGLMLGIPLAIAAGWPGRLVVPGRGRRREA